MHHVVSCCQWCYYVYSNCGHGTLCQQVTVLLEAISDMHFPISYVKTWRCHSCYCMVMRICWVKLYFLIYKDHFVMGGYCTLVVESGYYIYR